MLRNVTNGSNVFSEMKRHFVKTGNSNDSSSPNIVQIKFEEYSNLTGKFPFYLD